MDYILLFIIIIIVVISVNFYNSKKSKEMRKDENIEGIISLKDEKNENYASIYAKRDYLLSQNELKFYKLLKGITTKYNLLIFTQVTLYEIINNKNSWNYADFNKIRSKSIDFVITDVNTKIKFCIELDDPSHLKEQRIARDNFIDSLFRDLGIKLLRIPVQSYYNLLYL